MVCMLLNCTLLMRAMFYFVLYTCRKKHDSEKTIERPRGGPKDKVKEGGGMQIFHQQLPRVRHDRVYRNLPKTNENLFMVLFILGVAH